MRFDESARRLLLVCVDKSVRVIDLSPDTRPVAELAEHARLLANRTLDDSGSLVPLDPAVAQELWEKHRPPADKP
jgi:hypothetical protein